MLKTALSRKLQQRFELGDYYAGFELAKILIRETNENYTDKIITLLKGAIRFDIHKAAYELAQFYECDWNLKKSEKKALEYYQYSLEKGVIESYNRVAVFYEGGVFLDKNLKKANFYYKKGAMAGDCIAQYNLAQNYEKGIGCKKNYQEAMRWYKAAELQGFIDAKEKIKKLLKSKK